ncbi:MAG: hypothetical protein ACXWCM_00750 [Acidimicrobiales bacterium]
MGPRAARDHRATGRFSLLPMDDAAHHPIATLDTRSLAAHGIAREPGIGHQEERRPDEPAAPARSPLPSGG